MDAQLPITFILSLFPSTHLGCIRSHSLAGLPVASPRKFADSAVGNLIYFVRLATLCHGRSKAKVALFPLKSLLRSYCLLLSAVVSYIRYELHPLAVRGPTENGKGGIIIFGSYQDCWNWNNIGAVCYAHPRWMELTRNGKTISNNGKWLLWRQCNKAKTFCLIVLWSQLFIAVHLLFCCWLLILTLDYGCYIVGSYIFGKFSLWDSRL